MAVQRAHAGDAELRCHCGSLMARVTPRGIELKCRRCKRVVIVAAERVRCAWGRVPLHSGGAMVQ
jgi:hypothetical protein